MSVVAAINALKICGSGESQGSLGGGQVDEHERSLSGDLGTFIQRQTNAVVNDQPRPNSAQKHNGKANLDDACQRVRLYCEDGAEPMEFIMPTDKELQYREAMVAYSIKRSETISEEELASAELRNQLVPWVVRLHSRSNFKFSTLYQAVRLVDRYLSLRTPPSELYQTIGATALFMAAKLEETMTSYALREWMIKLSPITLEALVDMENEMLVCLDYNIVTPNTFTFFELAATYFNLSRRVHCLALYLLELTLLDSKYLRYNCNLLAVSAIYLSLKLLDPSCWNEVVLHAFSLRLPEVRDVARKLLQLLSANLTTTDCYTHRKFSRGRFCRIGRMKL